MVDIFREKKNLMSSNDGDALSTQVQTQIKFSPFKLPEVLIFFSPDVQQKQIDWKFFLFIIPLFFSFSAFQYKRRSPFDVFYRRKKSEAFEPPL